MFNHNELGQRSLEDVIGIIAHQLRACGHVIEYSNNHMIHPYDGYNILVEGFTQWSIDMLRKAQQLRGARYIFIATEEPGELGFNGIKHGDMRSRQELFPQAAELCDGVLALVPGAESWYGRFAPAKHIELGYAPTLVREQKGDPEWIYGFYGSVTKRRATMFRKLERRARGEKTLRLVTSFLPGAERDKAMMQAKIILQIRIIEHLGLVSSSRCATALHLGRMVYAEPHKHSHPWDQVIEFAKSTEEFVESAIGYLPFWRSKYQQQLARFKDIMSPRNCVGRQIEELGLEKNIQPVVPGFVPKMTELIAGSTI